MKTSLLWMFADELIGLLPTFSVSRYPPKEDFDLYPGEIDFVTITPGAGEHRKEITLYLTGDILEALLPYSTYEEQDRIYYNIADPEFDLKELVDDVARIMRYL